LRGDSSTAAPSECWSRLSRRIEWFWQGPPRVDPGLNPARKKPGMCYTCGCKLPYEDHGDPSNVVEGDLKGSGQTEAIGKAGVKTAKENLLELIELEKEAGDLERPKQDYD